MKKYISVLAIIFIISLAACSNQTISSTPTGNESNIQSNSITTLDKGIWPVNEYTEGLPIPPGTVAWATLDTEHENCSVNLTGISDDDYSEYMEVLNQEGFSVIENVSEEIEEGNYVSIGTLLSNEDKWLSISYIPDSLTIYIGSSYAVAKLSDMEPMGHYFKPFTSYGLIIVISVVAIIVHTIIVLIYRSKKKAT